MDKHSLRRNGGDDIRKNIVGTLTNLQVHDIIDAYISNDRAKLVRKELAEILHILVDFPTGGGGGGSFNAANGLYDDAGTVKLGGNPLVEKTTINNANFLLEIINTGKTFIGDKNTTLEVIPNSNSIIIGDNTAASGGRIFINTGGTGNVDIASTVKFEDYGAGTKTAAALGVISSGYLALFATNGTIIEQSIASALLTLNNGLSNPTPNTGVLGHSAAGSGASDFISDRFLYTNIYDLSLGTVATVDTFNIRGINGRVGLNTLLTDLDTQYRFNVNGRIWLNDEDTNNAFTGELAGTAVGTGTNNSAYGVRALSDIITLPTATIVIPVGDVSGDILGGPTVQGLVTSLGLLIGETIDVIITSLNIVLGTVGAESPGNPSETVVGVIVTAAGELEVIDGIIDEGTTDITIVVVETINNSSTFGYNAQADKSNQVTLGEIATTQELRSGNYRFNVDQILTGANDGDLLTFDFLLGQFEAKPPSAIPGVGGVSSLLLADPALGNELIVQVTDASLNLNYYHLDGTPYAGDPLTLIDYCCDDLGSGLPTFTEGSIPFSNPSGNLTEDNVNLFWDDTNDVLKLGAYGIGNKEAADLTKTASLYIAAFATDGTILDKLISDLTPSPFRFQYDSTLGTSSYDPGAGYFTLNNADHTLATKIYFTATDKETFDGVPISVPGSLFGLIPGRTIALQSNSDPTTIILVKIDSAATLNFPDTIDFDIEYITEAPGSTLVDDDVISFHPTLPALAPLNAYNGLSVSGGNIYAQLGQNVTGSGAASFVSERYIPMENFSLTMEDRNDWEIFKFIEFQRSFRINGSGPADVNEGLIIGDRGLNLNGSAYGKSTYDQHRTGDSAGAFVFTHNSHPAAIGSKYTMHRTRGTAASPTATMLNDEFGSLIWTGYTGSSYRVGAEIRAKANENTASGGGSRLEFLLNTLGGTAGTPPIRFTFNGDGTTRAHDYGLGNKEDSDLTKTHSTYLSGYATDGTLLEVKMYGDFTNDTTAATGSVPVGGVYYNTTNNALHTRMS